MVLGHMHTLNFYATTSSHTCRKEIQRKGGMHQEEAIYTQAQMVLPSVLQADQHKLITAIMQLNQHAQDQPHVTRALHEHARKDLMSYKSEQLKLKHE